MSRHRHPEGSRLPALERNILKYRAFEMMLTLYYAEEIKRFLVNTMKATDHFREPSKKRFPKGVPHYRAVLEKICEEGHITAAQRDEIIKIVDYRNDIAHELQKMTFDISRSTFVRSMSQIEKPEYDYDMLERAKFYRKFLPDKALRRFVSELSFGSAVAYLMHISKKAINSHHKAWVKNGGKNRASVELSELYAAPSS